MGQGVRAHWGRLRHLWTVVAGFGIIAMVLMTSGTATAATTIREGAGVNASKVNENATVFRMGAWAWSSTYSNNPYSTAGTIQFDNFALLGLAVYSDHNRPGSNPYYPELASSWTIGKHSLQVHLRKSAKWQNGAPFTSKDVVDSLLLAGANYDDIWGYVTGVSAPNAHTVDIHLQSWAVAENVFLDLLQVTILPANVYGFLIPKGFEQDLLTYWKNYDVLKPTPASLAAASNSTAGKTMSATDTKLLKFNPKTFLGDGPYRLVKATVGADLFKKWNGWWDAKAIRVPYVEILPMSYEEMFGGNVSGTIDFQQDTQFTDPQVKRLDAAPGGHYVFIPSPVQQESLVFHLGTYPFGILQVREALAYIIQRRKVDQLDMGGTLIQNPPQQAPDGINIQEAKQYLTTKQMDSLKQYDYNPTKAASLLKSVGFTKRDGRWYTPKGKLWKFTITEEAGESQFDEDGLAIAGQLKKFGIDATTTDTNAATYGEQQEDGDYAVSENFMDWGLGGPLADFAATFVTTAKTQTWNYPVYDNGQSKCTGCQVAIGIGPVSNVPGLGKVNIGATLNKEVNTAPPSQWKRLTWDWARWINQNLPILPLYNNAFHESYSTNRYTDFPPDSQKWLWTVFGGAAQPVVWQQLGYMKLK